MMELKPCPFCGGKMKVSPYINRIIELPKPIKLFGRWSLTEMRYREIPVKYYVECAKFCEGFCDSYKVYFGDTAEEAIEAWNGRAGNAVD